MYETSGAAGATVVGTAERRKCLFGETNIYLKDENLIT